MLTINKGYGLPLGVLVILELGVPKLIGELKPVSLCGMGWGDENAPGSVWSVAGDVGGGAGEDVSPILRLTAGGEALADLAGELSTLPSSSLSFVPKFTIVKIFHQLLINYDYSMHKN